jgi:hypothetical protein
MLNWDLKRSWAFNVSDLPDMKEHEHSINMSEADIEMILEAPSPYRGDSRVIDPLMPPKEPSDEDLTLPAEPTPYILGEGEEDILEREADIEREREERRQMAENPPPPPLPEY